MEYNLVSGDSHVDMSWLPGDLFIDNSPQALKERMPHVADTDEGERWIVGDQVLGVAGGAGFSFLPTLKNRFRRMDRMIEMGFLDGMVEGRYHPTDPDPPHQGYGPRRRRRGDSIRHDLSGHPHKGPRNRRSHLPRIQRLGLPASAISAPDAGTPSPASPSTTPSIAGEELRRVAALGLRGSDLYVGGTVKPIYVRDGYWDPLWEAAAETQMPISFHIGGGGGIKVQPPEDDANFEDAYLSGASLSEPASLPGRKRTPWSSLPAPNGSSASS